MTPKPTRRPRKLLLTIALTAALLLCSLATFSLNILRGSRPVALWMGNTAYVLQSDVRSPNARRVLSNVPSIRPDDDNDLITIGSFPIYPSTTDILCSDNPLLVLGDTALYKIECNPLP